MNQDSTLVRRITPVLRANPARVISKFFLPGTEVEPQGVLHVDTIIARVLKMSDEDVTANLAATLARYAERHYDLHKIFINHFGHIAHHLPNANEISIERRDLIGAYFTQEYAVEGAALFNPSIVLHPDQTGLKEDEIRFILSVRALGEGHISSIEFRTGVFSQSAEIQIDEPGHHLVTGHRAPITLSREFFREGLAEFAGTALAEELLRLLPAEFDTNQLDEVIASVEHDNLIHEGAREIVKQIRRVASANYRLAFPPGHALSECVIYPTSADESHGIEDARFTKFAEDDGKTSYYATYTAFDGFHLAQHLLKTNDFQTFDITKLMGPAARNKGLALFPRRVNGAYLAISRWDSETISIAHSSDMSLWSDPVAVQFPEEPWEFVKLGNCGSPIETEDGWLVLTHGVGPMREYGIGAILLDRTDPTKMIGALKHPLLTSTEEERDGYVPNVVYSCGALLNQQTLILPYGCSDSTIRIAYVNFPDLMNRLRTASR